MATLKNWTEDEIIDALQAKSLRIGDDYLVPYGHALKVVQRVRDELMAQLTEAQTRLSGTEAAMGYAPHAKEDFEALMFGGDE